MALHMPENHIDYSHLNKTTVPTATIKSLQTERLADKSSSLPIVTSPPLSSVLHSDDAHFSDHKIAQNDRKGAQMPPPLHSLNDYSAAGAMGGAEEEDADVGGPGEHEHAPFYTSHQANNTHNTHNTHVNMHVHNTQTQHNRLRSQPVHADEDEEPERRSQRSSGSSVQPDMHSQADTLRGEIADMEAQLALLASQVRQMEDRGRGISDANARVAREIKLRQSVDAARRELELRVEELMSDLKELEAQRMQADKAAAENADIAHAWKDRCDTYETAYKTLQHQHATTAAELQAMQTRVAELERRVPPSSAPAKADTAHMTAHQAGDAKEAIAALEERLSSMSVEARIRDKEVLTTRDERDMCRSRISALEGEVVSLQRNKDHAARLATGAAKLVATYLRTCSGMLTQMRDFTDGSAIAGMEGLLAAVEAATEDVHNTGMQHFLLLDHAGSLSNLRVAHDKLCAAVKRSNDLTATLAHQVEDLLLERGKMRVLQTDSAKVGQLEKQVAELREELVRSAQKLKAESERALASALANRQAEHDVAMAALRAENASIIQELESNLVRERRNAEDNIARLKATFQASSDAASNELRKTFDANLESRSKLVREWEEYANHWESRGREAERMNAEWESAFDKLQAEYAKLVAKHSDTGVKLDVPISSSVRSDEVKTKPAERMGGTGTMTRKVSDASADESSKKGADPAVRTNGNITSVSARASASTTSPTKSVRHSYAGSMMSTRGR